MEKISYVFFRNITIHDFITILCHVGFSILQVVWALQTNLFPYYKDKAFQGKKKKKKKKERKKNARYLGQSGRR